MEPNNLKRRGTIAEEAAVGLIEAKKEIIEEINKNKKKTFKENLLELKKEIYNSEYREFLSRDALAWCKLSFFYTVFYLVLAGFFVFFVMVFYHTIDEKMPTYFNKESVMNFKGVNPGLGFRPQIDPESEMIMVNTSNWRSTYEYLDLYLKKYEKGKNSSFISAQGKLNVFNYESVISNTPCSRSKYYGLDTTSPCVVVKLNRIYGWLPIHDSKTPYPITKLDTKDKYVYVACTGENSADIDSIGKIDYYSSYPNQEIGGINFKYFPYRNQPNYLSPLVFLHFKNVTANQLINVECKAYAKNIDNKDRLNRRGMVKFQLFVATK